MAIERSILKELTNKTLSAYLQARQYSEVFFKTYFPFKTVSSLDYTTLIGDKGNMIAADVVSYDSSAPLKTRKKVDKLTGTIPAIRMKKKMNESEILEYNYLSVLADDAAKQSLVDLVFDDVDACFDGIQARLEWLVFKAMSIGVIALAKTNNDGIVTENNIDFQVPDGNKTGVAVVWSGVAANTTPLTDMRAVKTTAQNAGHKLKYCLMRPEQFNYFRASAEVKNEIGYYLIGTSALPKAPNLATVNEYLLGEDLPIIRIMDQSITTEDDAGDQTAGNPWELGYITYIHQEKLGKMLSAPLAARLNPPKQEFQAVKDNVLIAKWRDTDPVTEMTRGEINAFPSFDEADRVYMQNTENVGTWS